MACTTSLRACAWCGRTEKGSSSHCVRDDQRGHIDNPPHRRRRGQDMHRTQWLLEPFSVRPHHAQARSDVVQAIENALKGMMDESPLISSRAMDRARHICNGAL